MNVVPVFGGLPQIYLHTRFYVHHNNFTVGQKSFVVRAHSPTSIMACILLSTMPLTSVAPNFFKQEQTELEVSLSFHAQWAVLSYFDGDFPHIPAKSFNSIRQSAAQGRCSPQSQGCGIHLPTPVTACFQKSSQYLTLSN